MNNWGKTKRKAVIAILKNLLKIGASLSDQQLIRIISLSEQLTKEEDLKKVMETAKEKILLGHPWVSLAKRIVKNTHPNYRRIIVNFFLNSIINSVALRRKIMEKEGFLPPFSIVISPSMQCNLHCKGCYAGTYGQEIQGLSAEWVDYVISQGKEMGIYFYTISGGEPFKRKDLLRVYERHNDCVFHIYTNGTLLDKDYIQELLPCGNIIPLISIEGSKEETDARRGEGIYEKVMSAMDNLREAGVPFGFSATHTSQNTEKILSDGFIDLMIEKGAIVGWFFQYIPIGIKPDLSFMPNAEDRMSRRQVILRWRETKSVVVYDFWNDGALVKGCIAGGRYLHVISNGDVEPCVFVHFAVDNIKRKSLKEILRSPFFQNIQKRQPYKDLDEKEPNYLRPCMIIDHPEVLRDVIKETGAHPTCAESEKILCSKIATALDRLAAEWKWTVGKW